MTQPTLFDAPEPQHEPGSFPYGNKQPPARSSDPVTSHIAADDITSSGLRDSQKSEVLRWLTQHPGSTSAELAHISGLDRHMVARRLPDLERDGKVRKSGQRECAVSGRPAVTWEAM